METYCIHYSSGYCSAVLVKRRGTRDGLVAVATQLNQPDDLIALSTNSIQRFKTDRVLPTSPSSR